MKTSAWAPVRLAISFTAASGCGAPAGPEDSGGDETEYCSAVSAWPAEAGAEEAAVLQLVNAARAMGGTCGGQTWPPTPVLQLADELQCAARVHTRDMAQRGFFDHDNPEGESPFDRMQRAGYVFAAAGENIAQGYPTAAAVVRGWLESPGHCANILSPEFDETGIAFDGEALLWTQTFGRALGR